MTLEEGEQNIVIEAFRFYRGNKTHTANGLGISYRTLDEKLKKYEAHQEEISTLAKSRHTNRAVALKKERDFFHEQSLRGRENDEDPQA